MTGIILIVGATGQQGSAVIKALSAATYPDPTRQILALTRSTSSTKAQSLKAAYPDIVLIEGDTRDPAPIFARNPSISSIFLVTVPPDDEEQAIPFLKAAVASSNKVNHIVFSSVDRGGDLESWTRPTKVPHFAAKHRIELQLRQLCDDGGKSWTIFRPTGFMDTYNPGFFGKFMASLWATGMPVDRRMQLISTHDIGIFATKSLLDPEQWAGKAVALAGDELSLFEMRDIFKQTVGMDLPETYGVLAHPVLWWVEDARTSFEWFRSEGYGANIATLRQLEPGLQNFQKWLRESSRWETN